MSEARDIGAPWGRLGVLMPGMGAVATTLVAGVELVKGGLAEPRGSLTQLGTIRLIQLMKLKNTLRAIKGEDLITHLGLDYYE